MRAPTSIAELPEFWRRRRAAVYGADSPAAHSVCADELEAALAAQAPKQPPVAVEFRAPDPDEIERIIASCGL